MSEEGYEEQRASQEQAQQPLDEHSGAPPADSNTARGTECLAPLTAPEECTAVTADQGVLKLVLAAGIKKDKPPQFSRCLGALAMHAVLPMLNACVEQACHGWQL